MCIPFIDWNGNGELDSQDIAITLAITDNKDECQEDSEDVND